MRRINVFNSISLDGYFTGVNGDLSWAHAPGNDSEWNAFVSGNASGAGTLLFGRITYDMMVSYWPTPMAAQAFPAVAEGMNRRPKIVVSKTLESSTWNNTTILRDLIDDVRQLKLTDGHDIVILGSGSVVAQLAKNDLIDQYQIALIPVVLGKGRTMFEGLDKSFRMSLTSTRAFANGNTVLTYSRISR